LQPAGEAELLNDDRVGRTLDRLFDSDRASLITTTVLGMLREFAIATDQLHNDSTTVTVTGDYPDADGRTRGGKPTPAIRQGHSKDYRPDLKQLLFILTISADGAVPIAYRVADGKHGRRPHAHPDLGQTTRPGRAAGLYVRRGQQAVFETGDGPHPQLRWTFRDHRAARAAGGHLVSGLGPDPVGARATPG